MTRTRRLLVEALGALLHEKRYDAIVVQEILDRANVGRSTFYTHFRDKDELLRSALGDVVRASSPGASPSARRSERVIRFSRPMFEHVAQQRRAGKAVGFGSHTVVHERLRQVLAERIAEEIGAGPRQAVSGRVPLALLVQHVTSSFVLVLNWWIESGSKLSPAEIDDVFRALVLPTLAAALD